MTEEQRIAIDGKAYTKKDADRFWNVELRASSSVASAQPVEQKTLREFFPGEKASQPKNAPLPKAPPSKASQQVQSVSAAPTSLTAPAETPAPATLAALTKQLVPTKQSALTASMNEERCVAKDGKVYTKQQFQE